MTTAQYDEISHLLKEIVQILKKIEENTEPEKIEERRNRITGFANEDSPF